MEGDVGERTRERQEDMGGKKEGLLRTVCSSVPRAAL